MVQIDWKRIMAVRPESMTEQIKDELYETIAWHLPDYNTDRKHLIHFIRIAQEILKFKSEQVESLTGELDDIAAKQGEEEARERLDLIDEIERLKEELEYHRRISRDDGRPKFNSGEELRSEIVKLEIKNEELAAELQEREKDLMKEKIEVENYASQVASLQREKNELKRELTALQEEATEKMDIRGFSRDDSPEFGPEKQEEYSELIRQKNKHITQLLEDIDILEKQNSTLRVKLTNVCDELTDATNHINEMTGHLSQMKHTNDELEKKFVEAEGMNKSLKEQIEELIEEKAKHDKQLDVFSETLSSKVQEWKESLEAKNLEISKAEEEIRRLLAASSKFPEFPDLEIIKKVTEQEQEIVNLKNELIRATHEINNCTELIESFKEKQSQLKYTDTDQLQAQCDMYEDRIKHLEQKLKYAEDDAQAKAEEISEIVIQLREYELGQFGLPEAMNKIKYLEKCLEKKELQIEKLVEGCNCMEIEYENLKEQNIALRDRLGVSDDEYIDTTNVKLKFRKDLEVIKSLKFQLDRKEEELVKVKLKCHKLIKFIRHKPKKSRSSESSVEMVNEEPQKEDILKTVVEEKINLEKKIASIIKENDALRKGMHEILESIQSQSVEGTVEIQSSCLERLLEALDSRHVSGWYHPAMRLQAQLNNAEGKNEELRNQIRSFRQEEKSKNTELQDAYVKIRNLEDQLFILRTPRDEGGTKSRTSESEVDDIDVGSNEKHSLTNLQHEHRVIALETEIQELKVAYNKTKVELESLENQKLIEKEEMSSQIVGLENQISTLTGNLSSEIIEASQLQSQCSVQRRQVEFLKQLQLSQKIDNQRLQSEMLDQEEKFLKQILRLQNDKVIFILKIEKLQKELLESVPKSKLNDVNKELTEITAKYQDAVTLGMARHEGNAIERLEEEVKILQKEKNEVLDELRTVKEKLIVHDVSAEASPDSILAEKLAASEVRELNEKQKSAHLEKINFMLKSELQDLEVHNSEVTEYLSALKEEMKEFSKTKSDFAVLEKEEEVAGLQEKVDNLKKKLKLVESDRDNFRELFEISQGQLRSLDSKTEKEKLRIESLTEQVLVLQSATDEKAVIAKVSHELLTSQLSLSRIKKENNELQDQVTKLVAKNLVLETMIDDNRNQSFELQKKYSLKCDHLFKIINDLRRRKAVFPSVDTVHKMKRRLKAMQDEERRRIKELKNEMEEYAMKKEELAIKLEGLEGVYAATKDNGKQLMTWYSKGTSLRLEEARYRRQNRLLLGEIEQLESYIKRVDEEIICLEEAQLTKEKDWDQREGSWGKDEKETFHMPEDKGIEIERSSVSVQDKATETVNVTYENGDILEEMKRKIQDQAEAIKQYEMKIEKSETEINKLKRDLCEKTVSVEGVTKRNTVFDNIRVKDGVNDEAERTALKVTVQSLQNIIQQKEETIQKYQELLKEGRDEYSKSFGEFQEEIHMLQEALTKQSKAYSKLKNSFETSHQFKGSLPKIVEKYMVKIHELEDDVTDAQMTVNSLNNQVFTLQQEKDKWRALAEERLAAMEDSRLRLEAEYKNELENYKAEIENYQSEIEQLRQFADSGHLDGTGDHIKICEDAEIQEKLSYEGDTPKDAATDWPEKSKNQYSVKEVKILERQLKSAKDESTRLREQLRLLQAQKCKRPKTASSLTSRSGSDAKSSLKEDSLQTKVKTLEELLKIAKEREQDLIEGSQRRIKSAEEVAKWGEKKKSQCTIQNLNSKLKEREAEIEILKNKNDSFRNMIHKFERDVNSLEMQLKAAKGGSSGLSGKLEKLVDEKAQLQREVNELKNKLEMHQRHESGIGAALLYDKLESQERKLAVLELASKGRSTVKDEIEKLQVAYSNQEKRNLKLESENLDLHLQLEKERSLIKRLTDKNAELERMLLVAEEMSEMRQQESDRTISSLNEKISKVSADGRRTFRNVQSARLMPCPEKLKKEYLKLKEDHKMLRAKYLEMIDKNRDLEEEIKKYQYQIRLLEEKDLADSISKTNNLQLASKLSQELLQAKAQLSHKTNLLNRVKVLLTKAAAKEKALNEKVSTLENMVPGRMTVAGEV